MPPAARSPLGALNPSTQISCVTLPSASSRLIQPLPSLSEGVPAMFETNQLRDAASQYALSGASKPFTVAAWARAMSRAGSIEGNLRAHLTRTSELRARKAGVRWEPEAELALQDLEQVAGIADGLRA